MLNYHQELGNVFTDGIDNPESFSLKGDDYINGLIRVNGKNLVMNRVTLRTSTGEPYGAVFSLRDQNEMHVLGENQSGDAVHGEHARCASRVSK